MSVQFSYYLHFFGHRVHPHLLFELLGYTAGFQLYLYLRRRNRWPRAAVPFEQNAWLLVGCVFGALFGSKLLAWVESFHAYRDVLTTDPRAWLGGKTIVGGLLGGWAGVELAKRRLRVHHSTGDLFVFPLILGTCLCRVGCFLTGLDDHTCGTRTNAPWAVDFGDGPRHPTQLYEIAFLLLLAAALFLWTRRPRPNGHLFRLFMLGYLAFRFAVEFIKPRETPVLNLSAIQIACLGGMAICLWQFCGSHPTTRPAESESCGSRASQT